MNNRNMSTWVMWGVAGLVVGVLSAYLYFSGPANSTQTGDEGSSSTSGQQGGSGSSSAAPKVYSNIQYGYSVKYPGDSQNSVSHPEAVSFSFAGANNTKGTLAINVANDITHTAYCLSTPGGSTNIATSTINGVAFHVYTAMKSPSDVASTTHYKVLRKALTGTGSVCFDIQKSNSAGTTVGAKLDAILKSFTFK